MSYPEIHFLTAAVPGKAVKEIVDFTVASVLGVEEKTGCSRHISNFTVIGLFGIAIDLDHIPYYLGWDLGWFQDMVLSWGPFQGRLLHPIVPVVTLALTLAWYGVLAFILLDWVFLTDVEKKRWAININKLSGIMSYLPAFFVVSVFHLIFDYLITCSLFGMSCQIKYLPELGRFLFP